MSITSLFSQHIEMPMANFSTGNDESWSKTVIREAKWKVIKTNIPWEAQGHDGYNGYAWYRFHVNIPSAIKNNSYWKDSLKIFLAKIDDCDEVYLNGTLISKSGSFPDDKDGYISTWNSWQEIHISANDPLIKWDNENLIAVKVYDGGGGGGMFGAIPYISMMDLVDEIAIDNTKPLELITGAKTYKSITLINHSNQPVKGILRYTVIDPDNDKSTVHTIPVNIPAKKAMPFRFNLALAEKNNIKYDFEESNTHKVISVMEIVPYILTPLPSPKPRINGAKIFGVRPNSPFLYKIAATGKKPLQYRVENLPVGLTLNSQNGVISGTLKAKGKHSMTFIVSNALGTDKREFIVWVGDQLALTPPMGWNSWNCWGLSVSDEKVKASAKAMMDKGLIDHGWTYMNIDDGWEEKSRNEKGEIMSNKKFPDMKKLGNWLHDNGLKFGIYSSPGPLTCGGYLGSYQHEVQDAMTYSSWGIDYLKYDWCSYGSIAGKDSSLAAYKKPYEIMSDGLKQQPRDIVYSLCQYGMKEVWKWGADVNGNCWRTTGDIEDTWESLSNIGFKQTVQYSYARPGRWNDPDMMIVGQVGWGNLHATRLTPDEQYTHVSLWCLLSAPLLIGCDLSKLDAFTLNLLTNDEVLAVDQDMLGKQAQQVIKTETWQVWVKELVDGTHAIGIFNLSDKYDVIRFHWGDLGMKEMQKVRDLWRQKDLGNFAAMFATKVPPHGVTFISAENK